MELEVVRGERKERREKVFVTHFVLSVLYLDYTEESSIYSGLH